MTNFNKDSLAALCNELGQSIIDFHATIPSEKIRGEKKRHRFKVVR